MSDITIRTDSQAAFAASAREHLKDTIARLSDAVSSARAAAAMCDELIPLADEFASEMSSVIHDCGIKERIAEIDEAIGAFDERAVA